MTRKFDHEIRDGNSKIVLNKLFASCCLLFVSGIMTNQNIARNSEPDKAGARDSLSIKNFDFLAFDWLINFIKM